MITPNRIVTIALTPFQVDYCRRYAKQAEVGGKSNIRGDKRAETLAQDQQIGIIGHFAFIQYWTGSAHSFQIARWYANIYRESGDGGADLPGSNLDVKSSIVHNGKPMLDYHLAVRPREMHAKSVYVLALVDNRRSDGFCRVSLIGWASCEMLPHLPERDGIFTGAHVIAARDLEPLPPVTWWRQK